MTKMLYLLIGIAVLSLLASFCRRSISKRDKKEILIDPVCGMDVSDNPYLKSKFGKKTYYFCSQVCKNVFDRMPQNYM